MREIIGAMVNTFTNTMAERLNGRIQEVKAYGRGFKRFEKYQECNLIFPWRFIPLPNKLTGEN